jgi:hypothetical protein
MTESDHISSDEFQRYLEKMVILNIIKQGKDSKDKTEFYYPTKSFETHLQKTQESIPSEEAFGFEMAKLIEMTGSLEAAKKTLLFTVVTMYLKLSEKEMKERKPEIMMYAEILLRLGWFMGSKRDQK